MSRTTLRRAAPAAVGLITPFNPLDLELTFSYLRMYPDDGPVLTPDLKVVGFTSPKHFPYFDHELGIYLPDRGRKRN